MNTKRDLIQTIHCDRANLEHIAKHQIINGTLLIEIERIMQEYANEQLKLCVVIQRSELLIDFFQSMEAYDIHTTEIGLKEGVDKYLKSINRR